MKTLFFILLNAIVSIGCSDDCESYLCNQLASIKILVQDDFGTNYTEGFAVTINGKSIGKVDADCRFKYSEVNCLINSIGGLDKYKPNKEQQTHGFGRWNSNISIPLEVVIKAKGFSLGYFETTFDSSSCGSIKSQYWKVVLGEGVNGVSSYKREQDIEDCEIF